MTANWTPMSTTRTRKVNIEVRAAPKGDTYVCGIHCLRLFAGYTA